MVNDPEPRKAANEYWRPPTTGTVQAADQIGASVPSIRVRPEPSVAWSSATGFALLTLARGQRGAHWRTVRRILAAIDASVSDFASEIDAAENSRRRS